MSGETHSYGSRSQRGPALSKTNSFAELRSLMLEVTSQDLETLPSSALDGFTGPIRASRTSTGSSASSEAGAEVNPRPQLQTAASLGPRQSARGRTLSRQFSEGMRRNSLSVVAIQPIEACKPVLPITASLTAHLQWLCENSKELLNKLQKPKSSRSKNYAEPIMPKTALRFSKGLAFQFQKKLGLVASWTWGSGFVIAKLPNGQFSAPCFIADRFFSFGLTGGYLQSETCYAIPTNTAMKAFLKESTSWAVDSALTLGIDPLQVDAPTVASSTGDRAMPMVSAGTDEGEDAPRSYRFIDGAILDLSTRCGVHMIDEGINEALYGPECTADKILRGEYEIPEVFKPLYEYITNLAAVAPVLRKTVSQFEAEKERVRQRASWKSVSSVFGKKSPRKSDTSASSYDFSRSSADTFTGGSPTASLQTPSPSNPVSAGSSFRLFGDSELLDLNLDESDDEEEKAAQRSVMSTITENNNNNVANSTPIAVEN